MIIDREGWTSRCRAVVLPALACWSVIGCGAAGTADPADLGASRPVDARSELRSYVEDAAGATASRYGVTDDRGQVLDAVKIISASETGGFIGVYHTFREAAGTFDVHLATSSNLLDWTWRVRLADQASQPTIKPASDGGYVVAWEQEPPNHLRFAYYPTWTDLLAGAAQKTLDAPLSLSTCAEGTPNLYSASRTFLDVGFHFYDDCDLDRQAHGTTDWTAWAAAERPSLEQSVRTLGVMGGVGDRDIISFRGFDFTLIEGQVIKGDWSTWRVFLYDDATGEADQLDIRTEAGSTAFTNPTVERIEIGGQMAIVVTLFVPSEGARGGEAGQLIYYRTYEPAGPE